jgi:hypothetical protein
MTSFQSHQRVVYRDTDCGEEVLRPAIVVRVAPAMTTGTVPVLIRICGHNRPLWVPESRLEGQS